MLVLSDLHRREVGPEEAQYLIDLIYAERLLALLQFPGRSASLRPLFPRGRFVSARIAGASVLHIPIMT